MTAAFRFLIEDSFEEAGADLVRNGRPHARQALLGRTGARLTWPALDEVARETSSVVAEPERPMEATYTQAELDEAIARTRAETAEETGRAVRAELQAGIEQRQAEALDAIARGLAEARAHHDQALRARAGEIRTLAFAIAQALARRALALAPLADVEPMLEEVIGRLQGQPRLELRLPPDLVEAGRTLLGRVATGAGYDGELETTADDRLSPGEARLVWRHGCAERDLARIEAQALGLASAWLPDEPACAEEGADTTADPTAGSPAGAESLEGTST